VRAESFISQTGIFISRIRDLKFQIAFVIHHSSFRIHHCFINEGDSMKFSQLCAAIILCCAIAAMASAQARGNQDPCENAQTTVEMRNCAGKEYQKADAELNRAYQQLMSRLADDGYKAALKTAQQSWIKYRDANCEFEAYLNRGGTIYPVVYTGCLSAMTTARTKELRVRLEQQEQ
jgi:uncharacterized protein YecT (DUF1311 family)